MTYLFITHLFVMIIFDDVICTCSVGLFEYLSTSKIIFNPSGRIDWLKNGTHFAVNGNIGNNNQLLVIVKFLVSF